MIIFLISNDTKTIRFLSDTLEAYSNQKFVEIEIRVFRKNREYLLNFEMPDLIFIDDNVEMRPSVETARIVRTKDPKAGIVLLSTNPERVFEAFSVKPHRFLIKPFTQEDVFQALDSYRKELLAYRVIIAKVDESYRVFSTEEVYALVADGRYTKIMICDEMVSVQTPFAKIEAQLPEEYFFKIHRSYVVNMKHIAKFTTEQVEMTNHSVLPLSRRRRLEFHVAYAEFVKGHTFHE